MYIPPNEVPYGYTPASMRSVDRWSVWQKQEDGRKIPFQVLEGGRWSRSHLCKSNNPAMWVSFKQALECYFIAQGCLGGLSFALGDGWCGFDFDDVIVDGSVDPQVIAWLSKLGGYQEVSQSGKGIKVILKGRLTKDFLGTAETGRQFKGIPKDGMATEVYDDRRFFSLTGTGYEVAEGDPDAVDSICAELTALRPPRKPLPPHPVTQLTLDDETVLQKIHRSRKASKFDNLWNGQTELYPSESEADMALASMLMFWCSNNAEQAERLFGQSALGQRDKWQREDYRQRTFSNAVQAETYSSKRYPAYYAEAEGRLRDDLR